MSSAPSGSPLNVPLTGLLPVLSMIMNWLLPAVIGMAVALSVASPRVTVPETVNWL